MPTRDENKRVWNHEHDWSDLGEVWTPHAEWKLDILKWTLERYLKPGMRVLELGPGGGRWTHEILKYNPSRLVLVDLAEKCIELCKQRFSDISNIEYYLNDGRSIPVVADKSIDLIWSFDCLVHVERDDIAAYFQDFRRILAPGGIVILHYATIDRAHGEDPKKGWRSDFTSKDMLNAVMHHQFKPLEDLYNPGMAHSNTSVAIFGHGPECMLPPPPRIDS
ncbi:MAG: class I SAM-dependent methyltransferase [Planctomycetota bacterium]